MNNSRARGTARSSYGGLTGNDHAHLPQPVAGSESVCRCIEHHVACLASTPQLALKKFIARWRNSF
jgi:hypothetical protein